MRVARVHRVFVGTVLAFVVLSGGKAIAADPKIDPKLLAYTAGTGVSGTIKSVGSDTMNNLMALWGESFKRYYPNVKIEIEGKGSATAPPALIAGSADFGPMSRDWKKEEIDGFEKKVGYKPIAFPVAIDMIAVFVHKDNPLAGKSLTLQQVDAIFSNTRKGGGKADLTTWGDLGLTGDWKDKKISLYGRDTASGTYVYFKEHALAKGDFKDQVKQLPGSSAVIQSIAKDKYGIGYSGIGYKTADVKTVPLAKDTAGKAFAAEPDYAYSGDYPLARFLQLSLNQKPNSALPPIKREFIKFVLSRDGQKDVVKEGFLPIGVRIADNSLQTTGIAPKGK